MRKIITFLGTKPSETVYEWQGQAYPGRVFAEALRAFVTFDKMLVLTTEAARTTTWPLLEGLSDPRIEMVPIPDGKDTEGMWGVFQAVIAQVDEGETVVFDITHGFRTLPFLAFLFAAYLKTAKKVKIEAIYYGALEMKDQNNGKAPVIDLSQFVEMLDWITATDQFVQTGDGRSLATLLTAGMPTGQQMGQDIQLRALGKNMKLAAQAIQTVSMALQVTRPMEVMESSAHLAETLKQALPVFSQRARPFAVLAEGVARQYGQFGLEEAAEPEYFDDGLRKQLIMIEWYLEREQVVQAATLLREWIVSLLAYHFGAPMFDLKQGRELVEKALNNGVERRKRAPRPLVPGQFDEQFEALPQAETLSILWSKVTELRNDIAHVGMRQSPQTASQLKQKVEALQPQLEQLADQFLLKVE